MDILSMGGYGGYVWTAYALAGTVVLVCILQSRRRHRRVRESLAATLQAIEGATETAADAAPGKAVEKPE